MRLNKISLKQAVAMLAATCTLGTCCIAGSVAWAEQQPKEVNTANIDIDKKQATYITLHKYEGPESKTQSDGTAITDTTSESSPLHGKKPVSGVKFTIWRVKKKAATLMRKLIFPLPRVGKVLKTSKTCLMVKLQQLLLRQQVAAPIVVQPPLTQQNSL